MFSDSQSMVVDNSPSKKSAGSPNSSASSTWSYGKPIVGSWAEEVTKSELCQNESENYVPYDKDNRMSNSQSQDAVMEMQIKNETSEDRNIGVEFYDNANEEKYDILVKNEKIKIPFKRRHSKSNSNESRSNSPNNSSNSETDRNDSRQSFMGHQNGKRIRHNSYTSSSSSNSYTESDPAVLSRRQKQIDYGKNTAAYERYIELIPKSKRTRDHPRTPYKYGKYSRRAFDGLVRIWRKQLHYYDPPVSTAAGADTSSDDSDSD